MPRRNKFPRMISNFRCCTECAPTCSAASSRMAIASASISLLAATGFLISCGVSPSVPQTSGSLCGTTFARKRVPALLLPADGDAVAQWDQDGVELLQTVDQPVEFLKDQDGVELLQTVDQPVEFLYATRLEVIRRCRPRR